MSDQAIAYRCGLYLPGHDVHWIQAKLSREKRDQRPTRPGQLIKTDPDGLVVVEVEGVVYRLWNHDPLRMERLVARNRGSVSYQPGAGLLRTESVLGNFLFCVADADDPELRECPSTPPAGSPFELLRTAGGFSMPGPDVLRWAELEEGD